jgi:hypothetical protein
MTSFICPITEQEFHTYGRSRRLFEHDSPRRYARIDIPGTDERIAISWRSDGVEPWVVIAPSSGAIFVGVDERLAVVGTNGEVLLSMLLESSLLTIERVDMHVIAVCELQAIVLDRLGRVESVIEFPDVIEQFSLSGSTLEASFMNGSSRKIGF